MAHKEQNLVHLTPLPSNKEIIMSEDYQNALRMAIENMVTTYIELAKSNVPVPKVHTTVSLVPQITVSIEPNV